MSCIIKKINTCEILGDSIFPRNYRFNILPSKVTAKIQKSDSPNVQEIELTKISNMFSLEIEPLNLAVGNYKITYIFEILISGKLIRKTGLIENLSILKIGCNCEKSENENLDFSIELNQTVIDVELNFSVLNIGSISESGKSAFDIAVENGFVGTEIEWLLSLKGEKGVKGIQGDKGDKGDKGEKGDKGDKGDAFTFNDFTPTQIAELQKPATDKVEELNTLESTLVNSENTRISNENNRISAENSRVTAESSRVTAENARVAAEIERQKNKTLNIKVTTPTSWVTGTMSETEVLRIEIPANSISENSFLNMPILYLSKIGTNGNMHIKGKLSTSPTMPTGNTDVIFGYTNIVATLLSFGMERMYIISDGLIKGFPFGISSYSSSNANSNSFGSKAFDRTVTNYLYVSITLANTADQARLEGLQLTNS